MNRDKKTEYSTIETNQDETKNILQTKNVIKTKKVNFTTAVPKSTVKKPNTATVKTNVSQPTNSSQELAKAEEKRNIVSTVALNTPAPQSNKVVDSGAKVDQKITEKKATQEFIAKTADNTEREREGLQYEFERKRLDNAEAIINKGTIQLLNETAHDKSNQLLSTLTLRSTSAASFSLVVNLELVGKCDLIDDLFTIISLNEGENPPCLFNVDLCRGPLNNELVTTVSGSSISNMIPIGKRSNGALSIGVQRLEFRYQPEGWPSDLGTLGLSDEQIDTSIVNVQLQGSNVSSQASIMRFEQMLEFRTKFSKLRRLILQGYTAVQLDYSDFLAKLDHNPNLYDLLDNRSNHFFDGRLQISPLYPYFSTDSDVMQRIIMDAFMEVDGLITVGRINNVSQGTKLMRATALAPLDVYSGALFNIASAEFQANQVTYQRYQTIANALCYPNSILKMLNVFQPDVNYKHDPTPFEMHFSMVQTFLNLNHIEKFIEEASKLIRGCAFFEEMKEKAFFSNNSGLGIRAGSASNMLSYLVNRYEYGDLNSFLNLMLLEHYSAFVDLSVDFPKVESNYISLFDVMDILLFSQMFPKLFWTNSVTFGARLSTLLSAIFGEEYANFIARNGLISEFRNNMWVRSTDVVLTQASVLEGKQYTILVVNGTNQMGANVGNIFQIAGLVQPNFGVCNIQRKNLVGFPMTTASDEYTTSWVRSDDYFNNPLRERFDRILNYTSSMIKISRNQLAVDQVKPDSTTLNCIFRAMRSCVSDVMDVFCRYGWIISETLANSFLICHEYINRDTYMRAQPRICLEVERGGNFSRAITKRLDVRIHSCFATFALLYVRGAGTSVDSQRAMIDRALMTSANTLNLPPLPTDALVKFFFQYMYASKVKNEELAMIIEIFNIETPESPYAQVINSFRSSFKKGVVLEHVEKVAGYLGSNVFSDLLRTIDVVENERSFLDLRGVWRISLTDDTGTVNYNDLMDDNTFFGGNLVLTDQYFNASMRIGTFLACSNLSPLFTEIHEFTISRQTVDRYRFHGGLPLRDYTREINFLMGTRILQNREFRYGPNQAPLLRSMIVIDDLEFGDIFEIVSQGLRFLFVIEGPFVFNHADYQIIYQLIMQGVLDLHVTNTRLSYSYIYQHDLRPNYLEEVNPSTSWILNSFLPCKSSSLLEYVFFDNTVVFTSPTSVLMTMVQYVFLPYGAPNNIIAENLYDNPAVMDYLPPRFDPEPWIMSNNFLQFPNGESIVESRGMNFASAVPFYTGSITQYLPPIQVDTTLTFN